jgi:DNA-binding HxlR family transcriptional regulator
MAGLRTYGDRCGVARALDLVGERWALLTVRELLRGPKRFTDLRVGLPHVSPDVLAQRLRELEAAGIVRRAKLPPPAASRVYELTPRGQELEPVVLELGRWGSRAPFPASHAVMGVDSTVLALQTLFAPDAAAGLQASYELGLGEHRFELLVADGGLAITRGTVADPDATIMTDPETLTEVLWHGRKLSRALRAGEMKIDGDRALVERFPGLFPAPVMAAG